MRRSKTNENHRSFFTVVCQPAFTLIPLIKYPSKVRHVPPHFLSATEADAAPRKSFRVNLSRKLLFIEGAKVCPDATLDGSLKPVISILSPRLSNCNSNVLFHRRADIGRTPWIPEDVFFVLRIEKIPRNQLPPRDLLFSQKFNRDGFVGPWSSALDNGPYNSHSTPGRWFFVIKYVGNSVKLIYITFVVEIHSWKFFLNWNVNTINVILARNRNRTCRLCVVNTEILL